MLIAYLPILLLLANVLIEANSLRSLISNEYVCFQMSTLLTV